MAEPSATDMPGSPIPRQPAHDYYSLLGVGPRAGRAELRHAFCTLSKQVHPDTTALPEAEAAERFTALKQAYAVLSDPAARYRYDLQHRSGPTNGTAVTRGSATGRHAAIQRVISPQRPLSPGEWFSLALMGAAVLCCAGLAAVLGWARV